MVRRASYTRMLPGVFTKDEQDAAFALQDAGVPHPTIDDDAWARIERRWAALPRIWGRGPWIDRGEHIVYARTTGELRARLYRVTTDVWGLELQGMIEGDGIHRGALDALLDRVVAAWPPAPPGADQPTEAQLRMSAEYTALRARTTHEVARPAAEWLAAPTIGPVVLPALDALGGACKVSWEGGSDGQAMTAAQGRAARTLVERGAEIREALLVGLFAYDVAFAARLELPAPPSLPELVEDVDLRAVVIARDERDGIAYTDFEFEDFTCGLVNASFHAVQFLGICSFGVIVRDEGVVGSSGGEHHLPLEAARWIESPSTGPVDFPILKGFQGACRVSWDTSDGRAEMTPAQERAARTLIDRAAELCDELCDRLLEDQRHFAEDDDFPKARSADELMKNVELRGIRISREERAGLAYTDFDFGDAWRVEHGLNAILHGTRVVAVGGYGDTRHVVANDGGVAVEDDGGPRRTLDGARIASRWVDHPYDAVVALPMWEGFRGRWDVRFVYEDDEQPEITDAQGAAAARLVDDGVAIRDALLGALFASYKKSAPHPPAIAAPSDLAPIIEARTLRIHAEEWDGQPYYEFLVAAPWRKFGKARVLMHGARVVGLTTKSRVAAAIEEDQDARLAARRAAKARKQARAKLVVKKKRPGRPG